MSYNDEVLERIAKEPDYVYLKRYGFSIAKLLLRYENGVPDHIIATGLLTTPEDVERIYNESVLKLRALMKVEIG